MAGNRIGSNGALVEDINSGKVIDNKSVLKSGQGWTTYYSPFGKEVRFPTNPELHQIRLNSGWLMSPPSEPVPTPASIQMADGTVFDLGSTGSDLSANERARLNNTQEPKAAGPTATYYSPQGDVLPNLPADPQSMREYLELGLSLTPPVKEAASS